MEKSRKNKKNYEKSWNLENFIGSKFTSSYKKVCKWKEVKIKPDKNNELIPKRKAAWSKDLITYNSHPWIMFFFNVLVIIWRVGVVYLKLDVQGQGGRRILDLDGRGEWGVLKIGKFSWTLYVYYP